MLATYNPDSRNMIDRCLFVDYDVDVKKKEYERYIGYFNTPGIKRVTYYWGGNKAIDVQCEEIMSNRNFNYIFVTEHVKEKLPPLVNAIAVDNPKYHFYKLAKHIAIPREDLMASHFPMTHIIMPGTSYSLGCIFKPFCIVGDFGHEIVYYNNQQYVMPHFGGVRIGKGVLIGSNTCVDAGLFDDTVIGDYTTIDNLCHIAHNVTIGKNCIIVAGSTIMGGVTIGDNTRVCSATIRDRLNVGSNVVVGMCSAVVEDAPDNCTVYGVPAKRR